MHKIASLNNLRKVKVVTLDVTGTLLLHKESVAATYASAVNWAMPALSVTANDLKQPFKDAYKHASLNHPCYGFNTNMPGKHWWRLLAADCLERAAIKLSPSQFDVFFQRLYQHYGCQRGYETIPDAIELLEYIQEHNKTHSGNRISVGVITNTPTRTIDSVLPMLGIHDYVDWFLCCRDIGVEKPDAAIFTEAHTRAQVWVPGVQKDEMLHIGDNFATDFCGARAAGYQAYFLGMFI